ncbi:hypothetical protein EDB81DRAFT_494652 [Dactylonectria macrodidyma]|uniref:Uncharacterized protein n=1 Tax=Dactylonectria macrodidyma TaxID=307937 RepID=A0A9P9EVR4_9HYPO|nr:hypothetical protein EDB81DRAFT_494652 [Dactylonectria macrodidyma]
MASSWRGQPLGIYVSPHILGLHASPCEQAKPNNETHVGPPCSSELEAGRKSHHPELGRHMHAGQSRNASSCGHFLLNTQRRRLVGNEGPLLWGVYESPCWPDRGTLGLSAGWAFAVGLAVPAGKMATETRPPLVFPLSEVDRKTSGRGPFSVTEVAPRRVSFFRLFVTAFCSRKFPSSSCRELGLLPFRSPGRHRVTPSA